MSKLFPSIHYISQPPADEMVLLTLLKIAIVMVAFDTLYIYNVSRKFNNMMQNIQTSPVTIRWGGVVLTYVALVALMYWFIIRPRRSVAEAFLLGVCVYGVYDGTNYATIRKWQADFAWMDTLWGGSLFALVRTVLLSV
jgi:uncharacterized membrane protein